MGIPRIDSSHKLTPVTVTPTTVAPDGQCPHGLPMGSCPTCSGGGGGGGGISSKQPPRRVAGLMSWDEAYALYMSIQNAKRGATADAEASRLNADQARMLANRMILAGMLGRFITPVLTSFSRVFSVNSVLLRPLQTLSTILQQQADKLTEMLQQRITQIRQFSATLLNRVIDITDKLAAIFGEERKLLLEALVERLKGIAKKIWDNRIVTQLFFIFETTERSLKHFISRQVNRLKKKLFGLSDEDFENI